MNAGSGKGVHFVMYGGERIEFRLRCTNRRTLAITVQPDLGVLVTAPKKAVLNTVLGKVRKRAGWIRRQQRFFREFLPQTPPRRYVSGETHRYLGRGERSAGEPPKAGREPPPSHPPAVLKPGTSAKHARCARIPFVFPSYSLRILLVFSP